jgi:hypothetical protein
VDAIDRLVPKTHPLDRGIAPDDPFELVATAAIGDPDVMLECILQEFLWMGWDAEQLLALFDHPGYPLLRELQAHYGRGEVRKRVEALVARGTRIRVTEFVEEPEEECEHGAELVQIQLGESVSKQKG